MMKYVICIALLIVLPLCTAGANDGNAGDLVLVNRAEWGAREENYTTIQEFAIVRVIIHHTGDSDCNTASECAEQVRVLQDYDIDIEDTPYDDISFNFLVGEDGRVYEGRGWNIEGVHTFGCNSGSIGIAFIGNFSYHLPNAAALKAVEDLIAFGIQQGNLSTDYSIHGPCDATDKSCDGDTLHTDWVKRKSNWKTLTCPGRASIKGDPHWTTYDGAHFDFQGTCKYLWSRSRENKAPDFEVFTKMRVWGRHQCVTMLDYVEIHVGQYVVKLEQRKVVRVNNKVRIISHRPFFLRDHHIWFVIQIIGRWMVFRTNFDLRVRFTGNAWATVEVSSAYANVLEGIAGNYDGSVDNDLGQNGAPAGCLLGVSWPVLDENNTGCSYTCPNKPAGRPEELILVSRERWKARKPTAKKHQWTPICTVIIHHTGGDRCYIFKDCVNQARAIQIDHMDNKDPPYDDIGFNFLVGEDGRVYEGRGWNSEGVHTVGCNLGSIGIAFIGNFINDLPNADALKAVEDLIAYGIKKNKLTAKYSIHGPCPATSDTCPADMLYTDWVKPRDNWSRLTCPG